MKIRVQCECGKAEIIEKEKLNDWECFSCKKETNFTVKKLPNKLPLVRYKIWANTSKESSWDAFEEAMEKAGHDAVWEDNREASFVGSEIGLNVAFDTIKKTFHIESIEYDNDRFYRAQKD